MRQRGSSRGALALVVSSLTFAPGLASAAIDARVQGVFRMTAHVTSAVDVRGERTGETLHRVWAFASQGCEGSVCSALLLRRERGGGQYDRLTLHRVGVGSFAGHGMFWVPLSCHGHTYPHGARAPYSISLQITQSAAVGGVGLATQISASYVNRVRPDTTPCQFGPSHDAATYVGQLENPPTPAGARDQAASSRVASTAASAWTIRAAGRPPGASTA